MVNTKTIESIDIDGFIGAGNGGWQHRGCSWDKSPCSETATHGIQPYGCGHAEHPSPVDLYCERHYALALLYTLQIEVPVYRVPFTKLISKFGPISSW